MRGKGGVLTLIFTSPDYTFLLRNSSDFQRFESQRAFVMQKTAIGGDRGRSGYGAGDIRRLHLCSFPHISLKLLASCQRSPAQESAMRTMLPKMLGALMCVMAVWADFQPTTMANFDVTKVSVPCWHVKEKNREHDHVTEQTLPLRMYVPGCDVVRVLQLEELTAHPLFPCVSSR